MPLPSSTVRDLPDALHDEGMLAERMAGHRPAVFLDYDGVEGTIAQERRSRS